MLVEHIILLAISSLGVIHGISLGVYLISNTSLNSLANRLLGLLLIVFGLRISKSILLYFTPDLDIMWITLGLTLILSFGPVFYFYVRSYLDNSFTLDLKDSIHGIPFLVFLVLNSFSLLQKEFYLAFGIFFIYLHFLGYIAYSYYWMRKFKRSSESKVSPERTRWLNFIHVGMVIVWFSYFMFLLDEEIIPYILGPVTYSLVIYPLSFWAISKKILVPEDQKYKSSSLDEDDSRRIITKLESFLKNEQPYLDQELKLPDVANELRTTTHSLSQVINQHYGQNFQQLINSYRVENAKRLLGSENNDHLTISAIAHDSGFNSLSAFNAAFKKMQDMTPSQYRKSKQHS
ncbi:helix-turn-helix domain-containing protein [Balneola sp. MJW-20]|uniref:helix-turn-helix domain-containing protein n=1 Tax=Gracilimonas aurantiaca TaxID=3234185 RepID=UPI00346757C2